jgi:hypothetical protein
MLRSVWRERLDRPYADARRCVPAVVGAVLATAAFALPALAQSPADEPVPVSGTVDAALGLRVGVAGPLGPFIPGIARDYTGTVVATVDSTSEGATLTVADLSASGTPGHLHNPVDAGFTLATPLAMSGASDAPGAVGSDPAAVSAGPLTLVHYGQPVSADNATLTYLQRIGASEGLRSGTYAKTLTLTLSTNSP